MARILIVDDEHDVVEYLIDELIDDGWQTGAAYNGVDAVMKVIDGGWDAVVMDFRMPKLNGVDALRIMKHLQPDLPVIMFTGQAGQGEMYEAVRLGAYTCLLKPIAVEKLSKALRQALVKKPILA